MKKVVIFAATALFFASCGNTQETADKAKIDSMSLELAKQRVVDSMNDINANSMVGASPIEATPPAVQSRGSSSPSRSRSSSRGSNSNNPAPANAGQAICFKSANRKEILLNAKENLTFKISAAIFYTGARFTVNIVNIV